MQEQESSFDEFIGKQVKILYKDIDKICFARGVLSKTDSDYIFLEGDFSQQLIQKSLILKMNSIKASQDARTKTEM